MSETETALALKQSVALLVILPTAIGLVSVLSGDRLATGVRWGTLMAIVVLLYYYWSDILGNPEHAGWLGKK
ncbi:hypothetical protein [Natronobacterium gregoryi]|uniref:Uncharacterized protein n=2 Tax=Natronobacterium gregoryi TaxID=44930 RepID=L0AL32_NATGS|nr:hypothetical protein [Natronobacterium gregoryi]AFZ73902.1 hypothetical protein Natgr_2757 [Natronobacterium gregoryi SP2]PLK19166.1 hypothetical protein CYV19_16330 [Natronobacterium gregoryi SP2]SFJ59775.1 hypothetical protein SAMN05443661_14423 [Natronobacterium gregoryi]